MVIPALRDAAEDHALRGAPLAVYVWAIHQLDWHEERALKVAVVAHALRIERETAGRALKLLVQRGYLARRHTGTRGYLYRTLYTRRAPEVGVPSPDRVA